MTLVDTSVWVAHLRAHDVELARLLEHGQVLIHPFVAGELACGCLRNRTRFLGYLQTLGPAAVASNSEVLHLLEQRKLWGKGIGWIDAHLLAAALLSRCRFWTLDQRLQAAASELGIQAPFAGA